MFGLNSGSLRYKSKVNWKFLIRKFPNFNCLGQHFENGDEIFDTRKPKSDEIVRIAERLKDKRDIVRVCACVTGITSGLLMLCLYFIRM